MELIHDDIVHVGLRAFTQSEIGENLCRTANDGGAGIHGGIARDHAYMVWSKDFAERQKLFVGQRLNGDRIIRTPSLTKSEKMQR